MELPGNENAEKITILIAEDDDSNYTLFHVLLKQEYKLVRAHNGREAVQLFRECNPLLILMDIKMPEMDGFEATAAIRQLSSSVPIIAVTAYAFQEDQERILSSGFSDYLAKPIKSQVLKNKIEEHLPRS